MKMFRIAIRRTNNVELALVAANEVYEVYPTYIKYIEERDGTTPAVSIREYTEAELQQLSVSDELYEDFIPFEEVLSAIKHPTVITTY